MDPGVETRVEEFIATIQNSKIELIEIIAEIRYQFLKDCLVPQDDPSKL